MLGVRARAFLRAWQTLDQQRPLFPFPEWVLGDLGDKGEHNNETFVKPERFHKLLVLECLK